MSETCEYVAIWHNRFGQPEYCGQRATWRYPAMGGGYMHLCDKHAERHKSYAERINMERPRQAGREAK
jgi:hypothetical protein